MRDTAFWSLLRSNGERSGEGHGSNKFSPYQRPVKRLSSVGRELVRAVGAAGNRNG